MPRLVWAEDSPPPIDTSAIFKPQRNPYAPHPKPPSENGSDSNNLSKSSDTKPDAKDTRFTVQGHGDSTNGPSGGAATLRHRFSFDWSRSNERLGFWGMGQSFDVAEAYW